MRTTQEHPFFEHCVYAVYSLFPSFLFVIQGMIPHKNRYKYAVKRYEVRGSLTLN